jgi:hypothetical protein
MVSIVFGMKCGVLGTCQPCEQLLSIGKKHMTMANVLPYESCYFQHVSVAKKSRLLIVHQKCCLWDSPVLSHVESVSEFL